MYEKTYTCFQPTYMNEFHCDGNLCQSRCCRTNWEIEIDGDTYQRYRSIKSKDERKNILRYIEWRKYGNERKPLIKHKKDGVCPFLREDYLCGLQKKYGEKILSMVCATYPRFIVRLDDITERGLALSCPVAAKLILLKREPMEFEQTEIVERRPFSVKEISSREIYLVEYMIYLQYASISILQKRKLTIDQRLLLLGFFFEQAEELVVNGKADEICDLSEDYASDQVDDYVLSLLGNHYLQVKEYLRCMFNMREALYGEKNGLMYKGDEKYLEALAELYRIPKKEKRVSLDWLQEVFEGYRDKAKYILREYSYIFENCMVNTFFINLYPIRFGEGLVESYMHFLMSYKMMEFFTIASAVTHEKVNEEILVDGLSLFSSHMEHSTDYRTHIQAEILRYRRDIHFFMSVLLDGRS